MKALRVLCILLLIVGGCLLLRALYMHAKADLARILVRRAWEQSVKTGESRAPWPWADTHPVARLRIARLNYDEIVLDGATPRTLAFGPARLFSASIPGEGGNLVLAGHRTSWFLPLKNIVPSDQINVEWYDPHGGLHQKNYSVDFVRVVDPQEVDLLAPTADDVLTLITCYPFGYGPGSPQRYIVRATPRDTKPNNTSIAATSRASKSSIVLRR